MYVERYVGTKGLAFFAQAWVDTRVEVQSAWTPIGSGLLSKPDLVQNVMTSSSLNNVPMLVAGINDNIIS